MNLNWQQLDEQGCLEIPTELRSWLIDTGSLTVKLRQYCDNFSVHLIAQVKREATASEVALLDLDDNINIIDREVQLYCDGQAVIYARSLIPVVAIIDRFDDLDNLGEKPLGEKIFSDPQLERSPIEWTRLSPDFSQYQHMIQGLVETSAYIYGRRSLFYGALRPILISEFYLPSIVKDD